MTNLDGIETEIDNAIRHDGGFVLMQCSYVKELITRLRQAEKDAARYRWIKANGQLGVGRCGIDWELYFEGPAPDNSAMIELHIDEAMQCK